MNSIVLKSVNQKTEKFEEMTSGEVDWTNLLGRYGNMEELNNIISNSKAIIFGIMKYRRILRNRGLGVVSLIEINTAYTNNNLGRLHSLLQELFLEPISSKQYQIIMGRLNKTEDGIEKLYERHLKDKNLRVLSVIKTL